MAAPVGTLSYLYLNCEKYDDSRKGLAAEMAFRYGYCLHFVELYDQGEVYGRPIESAPAGQRIITHVRVNGGGSYRRKSYPIQSSAGGRLAGLVASGDERSHSSSSISYRRAMAMARLNVVFAIAHVVCIGSDRSKVRKKKVLPSIIQCAALRRDREKESDWRESRKVRRGIRGSEDVARGVTAEQVVDAEVRVDCRSFGIGQVGG